MRFLANENVPGAVVAALRERGHDVFWIKESMRGAKIQLCSPMRKRNAVSSLPSTGTSASWPFDLTCQRNRVSF